MAGIFRFALPALAIYAGYRLIKSSFSLQSGNPKEKIDPRASNHSDTIEICPDCGHEVGNRNCAKCNS